MRSRRRLAATITTTLLAALCAAPPAWAGCPGDSLPASAQAEAQLESSILCLINERRAGARLRALSPNARLRGAALRHSSDMVGSGYFAHTSPSGLGLLDRILSSGYTRGVARWSAGENLAWGTGAASTPASLVEAWMGSTAHRDTLLKPRFRELGVGAVRGTPLDAADGSGITVSSEFGSRSKPKKGKGQNRRVRRR